MKKLTSIILIFVMLLSVFASSFAGITVYAETTTSNTAGAKITWKISGKTLILYGSGQMEDYDIGGCSEKLPGWYDKRESINTITISNKITHIGNYSFSGFLNLKSITIGNNVVTIGDQAFDGCKNLKKAVIGSRVKTIGNGAFKNCSNMVALTIGGSVTSIGDNAFEGCINLKSLTIPNKVTNIGVAAFRNCSNITTLKLGKSVSTIGEEAFINCAKIKSIALPSKVTTIGNSAFQGLVLITSVTIPSTTKTLGSYSFKECKSLKSVVFNGPTEIGERAFINCSNLSKVNFGKKVKSIGNKAFFDCTKITSISLPATVETIGNHTFANCSSLKALTLTKGLKSIGEAAFENCSLLTKIVIPSTVTNLGSYAFKNCSAVKSLSISGKLTSVPYEAFRDCTSLTSVVIPNSVVTIEESAFRNCISLITLKIGNSCTTINEYAFRDCSSLKNISFGEHVNVIGHGAFENCDTLKSVTFNNSLLKINDYAFYDCDLLTTVKIGSNITNIGYKAFALTALQKFTINSMVTEFNDNTFGDNDTHIMYCNTNSSAYEYANSKDITTKSIVKKELNENWFNLSKKTYTWNGKAICPAVVCTKSGIVNYYDFETVYDYDSSAGIHYVDVYGLNEYDGYTTLAYRVSKANQVITAKNITKTADAKPFNLGAKRTFGDGKLTYKSSNTKVATINKKGVVTIKGAGVAKITIVAAATGNCNKTAKTIVLTVKKAKQVLGVKNISKTTSTKSFTLPVKRGFGDGKLKFKSSNTKIATINSKGVITIKRAGTVKITVIACASKNCLSTSKTITLSISRGYQKISASNITKTRNAKSFYLNAKRTRGNGKLTYSSSNPKVAVVNSKGKVIIKGKGTARITIKAAATKDFLVTRKTITVKIV